MKKMNWLLSLSFILFAACGQGVDDPDVSDDKTITLGADSLQFTYAAGSQTIDLSASDEWSVTSNNSWCSCFPIGGIRGNQSVTIKVNENSESTAREAMLTFRNGSYLKTMKIKQAASPGYKIVWQDEFNTDKPSMPSTTDWWYETGGNGWGNNELQNYVSGKISSDTLAYVSGGTLKIYARKINGTVYSIRMNTSSSWKYGYFEARLKLPKGKGTWPAFWMLPKNFTAWPADGEIDIMEEVGFNPNYVSSSIHCTAYNHTIGTQKTAAKYVDNAEGEFHVYAVEWTANYIKGFVDGVNYFTFDNDGKGNKNTWPFDAPFYLKLNLAWGGNWGGANGVDESALPLTYEIDYVRVYQK
jgi:hypothetical protein